MRVFGVRVDSLSVREALERVEGFVQDGGGHQIITANPLMLLATEKSPGLRAAFDSADLVLADSVGMQWAAARQGHRLEKISGIDFLETLCHRAVQRGWGVFFLGAAPGVADAAAKVLEKKYPGLRIVGVRHGYDINETVVDEISRGRPELLFVGLGTPGQDVWIAQHLKRLNAAVAMGVGGSFDVLSGRLRRAPRWIRAVGLEWFYRLLQEPHRARRMMGLPLFVIRVLFSNTWKKH